MENVFIGRREDGTIYGVWACRQWSGQEEKPENDPEVVAFRNRPVPRRGDPKPTSKIIDPRVR